MTLKRARQILGDKYAKHSDEQIQEIIDLLGDLAELEIKPLNQE